MDGVAEHAVRTAVGFVCLLSAMIFAARLFEVSFPAEPDRPRNQVWLDYKIVGACLFMPWALSSITAITSAALISTFGGGLFHLMSKG